MRPGTAAALVFAWCFTAQARAEYPTSGTAIPRGGQASGQSLAGRAQARAHRLRAFAEEWLGTPYLWGGTTKVGIDCSGYLREMFRRIYDLELPRTTSEQINTGVRIALNTRDLGKGLEPGDLFFYVDSTGTPNHVVTYIGHGRFTHSASGRGVVIDGFNALWGRRIVGRRVLAPATGAGPRLVIEPLTPYGAGEAEEVPCPPTIRPRNDEVRRYRLEVIGDLRPLGDREICEWKALEAALARTGGPAAEENRHKIDDQIKWLESIEGAKEQLGR